MNTLLSVIPEVLEDTLVPIFICVILPCVIVWLVMWSRRNEINRKTEVAIKAIEHGAQIDPNYFANQKKEKSIKRKVFNKLKTGIILSALGLPFFIMDIIPGITGDHDILIPGIILLCIGIAFFIIYFISRNHFDAEIRAEEKQQTDKAE